MPIFASVKHPDGIPMPFSSSLASFVENYTNHVSDSKERFSIGRWLRTLTDSQLAELLAMTEHLVREPGSAKLDDVVYVVKIAHNRETGKNGFPKPKLIIKAAIRLVMIVSFVSFERSGGMIMKSPLRVHLTRILISN